MPKQVDSYKLAWDVDHGAGLIKLSFLTGGNIVTLPFTDGGAFTAAAFILQNEDPVYYDVHNKRLYTEAEPVVDDD